MDSRWLRGFGVPSASDDASFKPLQPNDRTGPDRIRQEASRPRTAVNRSLALTLLDDTDQWSYRTETVIGKKLISQESATPPARPADWIQPSSCPLLPRKQDARDSISPAFPPPSRPVSGNRPPESGYSPVRHPKSRLAKPRPVVSVVVPISAKRRTSAGIFCTVPIFKAYGSQRERPPQGHGDPSQH